MIACSQESNSTESKNQSLIEATLAVAADRIVVDQVEVLLSPRFRRLAPGLTTNEISHQLRSLLNRCFDFKLPLSIWSQKNERVLNYLEGKPAVPVMFSEDDFVDLPAIANKLKQPTRSIDTWLVQRLSSTTKAALQSSNPTLLYAALLGDFNRVLTSGAIYESHRFGGIDLRSETRMLLAQKPRGDSLAHLNRLLIEDAYPTGLAKNHDYGPLGSTKRERWADAETRLGKENLEKILRTVVGSDWFRSGVLVDSPFGLHPDVDVQQLSGSRLKFTLADPIAAADVSSEAVRFEGKPASCYGVTREELAGLLSGLAGSLWWPREIRVRVADFYARRGIDASEPYHLALKIGAASQRMHDSGIHKRECPETNHTSACYVKPKRLPLPNHRECPEENHTAACREESRKERLPSRALSGGATGSWKTSLDGLEGQAWEVRVEVKDFDDGSEREIQITEPPAITEIWVPVPRQATNRLCQIFYCLLDRADYEALVRNGLTNIVESQMSGDVGKGTDPKTDGMVLLDLHEIREQPWPLHHLEVRRRAVHMAELGYVVSFGTTTNGDSALVVGEPPKRARESAPQPAVDSAGPAESGLSGLRARHEAATSAATASREEEKEPRNLLGLSAGYDAEQGFSYDVSYRRLLLDDRTASVQGRVGQFTQPFGDLSFAKDDLFLPQIGRRLRVEFKGYSHFEPDRQLNSELADERRSGGSGKLQLELWRAAAGHWVTADLNLLRELVDLTPSGGPSTRTYRNRLELSGTWFYNPPAAFNANWVRFTPKVALGGDGSAEFAVFSGELVARRDLGSGWEWNSRGWAAASSQGTPAEEQPQLGGDETVRGYRNGALTAEAAWAFQEELWMPLGCLERLLPGLGTTFRRQLFLASFVDIGGTVPAGRGQSILAGAGLGLRLRIDQGPVMKLDWGHGFLDAGGAYGGDRLHFNATLEFPF